MSAPFLLLGYNLRIHRKKAGKTRVDAAEFLNVDVKRYSEFEVGMNVMTAVDMNNYCNFINMSPKLAAKLVKQCYKLIGGSMKVVDQYEILEGDNLENLPRPYEHIGKNLNLIRAIQVKKSVEEVAKFLGVNSKVYLEYEYGITLPSDETLVKICKYFEINFDRVMRWKQQCVENSYLKDHLKNDIETLKETYESKTGIQLTTFEKQLIDSLKRDLFKINTLPVLPSNYIIILSILQSKEARKATHLHEIKDVIIENETFAGYMARFPNLSTYIFSAANRTLFRNDPCKDITSCFNRLTIGEFEVLLFQSTHSLSLYPVDEEIPILEGLSDFTSLTILMARELKPHLNVQDYKTLEQCLLLQGIGTYALYHCIHPFARAKDQNSKLSKEFMKYVIWDLHSIASAIIAESLGFSKEVIEIVRTHHNPTKDVGEVTTLLKMINRYAHRNFPAYSIDTIKDLLAAHPQLDLAPEKIANAADKLRKLMPKMQENSTTLLQKISKDIAKFPIDKITDNDDGKIQSVEDSYVNPPKRSDARFNAGFQPTLLNVAYGLHHNFTNRMLSMGKLESLDNYLNRVAKLNIGISFLHATHADPFQVVAENHHCSIDKIQKILFE